MKNFRPGIFLLIAVLAISFTDNTRVGAETLSALNGFSPVSQFQIVDSQGGSREIGRFSYMSGELNIMCEVIFPNVDTNGPFPALVLCHGGIDGIINRTRVKALELADLGYVIVMPSYRGEDGSDGEIEVAVGEVDDVLSCIDLLRGDSNIDKNRIAVIGSSHGALIAAFAAARDASIPAVVCAYGVMDIDTWWRYLIETNQYDWTDELSKRIYGDGPGDKPDEFDKRSGLKIACEIEPPVMIVQGDSDTLVPKSQAEALRDAFERCGKKNYKYSVYSGVGHGFIWYTEKDVGHKTREEIDTAYRAWDDMLEFIEDCWRNL